MGGDAGGGGRGEEEEEEKVEGLEEEQQWEENEALLTETGGRGDYVGGEGIFRQINLIMFLCFLSVFV